MGEVQRREENIDIQKGVGISDAAVIEAQARSAAESMRDGKPVVVDNGVVFALWANGHSEAATSRIEALKGRERGRGYGLTISFERFSEYIDFDAVHRSLWPLLGNPQELTSRLGAMAFIRVPGRKDAAAMGVPRCAITPNGKHGFTLQNYDPAGKYNVCRLLHYARQHGINFPIVTSLNQSGSPEIITRNEAWRHLNNRGVSFPFVDDIANTHGFAGSYPIIEFTKKGLTLVRGGSLGDDTIKNLLDGFKVRMSRQYKPCAHTAMQLESKPWLAELRGSELRGALLEDLKWKLPAEMHPVRRLILDIYPRGSNGSFRLAT